MARNFTMGDVNRQDTPYPTIYVDTKELIDAQPDWMKRGLQQTASGYGKKLNTGRKILFNGKPYRLYATCYSNVASTWFTVKGKRIYVD